MESRALTSVWLEVIDAFNAGELERALDVFHHDVVWVPGAHDPDSSPAYGREGVRRFMSQWLELFEPLRLSAGAVDEVGDRIVAELRVSGEGRESGAPIDQVVHQVIELRDGLVYRVSEYYDRAEALEIARSQ